MEGQNKTKPKSFSFVLRGNASGIVFFASHDHGSAHGVHDAAGGLHVGLAFISDANHIVQCVVATAMTINGKITFRATFRQPVERALGIRSCKLSCVWYTMIS